MKPETNEYIRNILDTFTGADGGIRFIKFKALIEDMDSRENDSAATEIVLIVKHFSRLIDVANL